MSRILVVEDDAAILRALAENLRAESYDVVTAVDGESACRLMEQQPPELIVLDVMLPRMSGYEVCRRARQQGITAPIVMLTAKGEESDRVLGLDLGADDYVTKPFSIKELLARVRALLRRARGLSQLPDRLAVDEVVVDFLRYEATRDGRPLELTRKEFGVLRLLVSRAGEVVSRDELLDQVWGYDVMPTTRTVDNHIASLRAKLEVSASHPRHLLTIHGVGYKWMK